MDHRPHRPLHGPDSFVEVSDLDKYDYRLAHRRTPHKMCLAVADAQDGEVCRACLLQPRFGLCGHQYCSLYFDVYHRYVEPERNEQPTNFADLQSLDLLGNLTGTSLTTFMLCTIELMLAGLCINIPMLRPFYLQWRAKYKNSSFNNSGRQSGPKLSVSGQMGSGHRQPRPGQYTQWIELVWQNQGTLKI